jgi:nicotinamidase-related amidase
MNVWETYDIEVPFMVRLFGGLPEWEIDKDKTALVIVDMQNYCAAPHKGIWTLAHEQGMDAEMEYYYHRLEVIKPNLSKLLTTCRQQNVPIVHVNGDVLLGRKARQRAAERTAKLPGSGLDKGISQRTFDDDADVVDPLQPLPNEIVVKKRGAGPFGITNIDRVLRSLDIEFLIVGGTATHQCVEMTIRGASDFGYKVIMVDDGTATVSEELQHNALIDLADWFCKVMTTEEVLSEVLGS